MNEIDVTHEERRLNDECGQAIDQAIRDTYTPGPMAGTGLYDNKTAVKVVVAAYGIDRVASVLAANINDALHDGRFTKENKEWAQSIDAPAKPDYYLDAHRSILNGFATKLREFMQQEQEKTTAPRKSESTKEAEEYLTDTMGFDKAIVKSCIELGIVYQAEIGQPGAVFAGIQPHDTFIIPAKEVKGKPATAVSVFENPMEVLAGATLAKVIRAADYANVHRISAVKSSLYSTHVKVLKNFLENNPNVRTVNLCLTNSPDGRVLAARINTMLKNLGEQRGEVFKVNDLIPTDANGYLDKLQSKNKEIRTKQSAKENRE